MNRVTTGSDRLDTILGGGFVENSINVIMGLPGTGKTILAEMTIFANASADAPAVYVSTVSEPLDKMLRYVQAFSFFDPQLIGEGLHYADLSDALRSKGLGGAIERIGELVKEYRPRFLVIDSFKALHAFADSPEHFRRHLSELSALLSSVAVTTFLVGEYHEDELAVMPEFAVADGIVQMVLSKVGVRDVRYVRVMKQRGSSFVSGEHALRITSDGIDVFPRFVAPDVTVSYAPSEERSLTGVAVLDEMVADGLAKGSATVVFGPPGSGKTLLGLHFVFKGIEMGEKGMIATMEENPSQLQRVAGAFGWDMRAAIDDGMLLLHYVSPVEVNIDEFVRNVGDLADEHGVKRILVDSLNDLEAASPSIDRFRDYMYSFTQYMSIHRISLFMTSEVRALFSTSILSEYGISHISDNVLLIHYLREQSEIRRAISVIKTRGSGHDPRIRQFEITSEGIVIGRPFGDVDFGSQGE